MASWVKKSIWGLVFCLPILFLISLKCLALDKRASLTLSHYIMALTYERMGDVDTAIEEYQRALRTDYHNARIHLGLAISFIKKNNLAKAIEELRLAANFEPEAVEPHAILALIYSLQNKKELANSESEVALKNASKLQPKNTDIYKSLGIVYLQQRNFPAAENVYRLILDLTPDDAEAHCYLGNLYSEWKNSQAAERELKRALELNPDYAEALNALGYLYVEENKNLEEAQIMIEKALEKEPNNGAYIDSLGWLYFKKGKFPEAKSELEKAAGLLDDPVIFDHLGQVYFIFGDKEKAKENWEKSLKLDPKQESVKQKLEELDAVRRSKNPGTPE